MIDVENADKLKEIYPIKNIVLYYSTIYNVK